MIPPRLRFQRHVWRILGLRHKKWMANTFCMTVVPRVKQKRGRVERAHVANVVTNKPAPAGRSGRIRAHGRVWWLLNMM
jgi:hypothetical protein